MLTLHIASLHMRKFYWKSTDKGQWKENWNQEKKFLSTWVCSSYSPRRFDDLRAELNMKPADLEEGRAICPFVPCKENPFILRKDMHL